MNILGIEFGSTRIKAVLINEENKPIASGGFDWENLFENGVWTYHLEDVKLGLKTAFKNLCNDFGGVPVISAIGISGMMHGYLVFDENDNQLCEFRTWRNTMTEQSAEELTNLLGFNIPQRWSVAHLYQAMLNKDEHISKIKKMTTLAGYVHYLLTGENVLGVGEASGMFPILNGDYNTEMLKKFKDKTLFDIVKVLPKVLNAGEIAGKLTEKGVLLLDETGTIKAGIPFCPPEGDAGTGMVATNSITPKTGNVSAGTSIFAMVVLENELSKVYPEIDMVATPNGKPVAMVHCNNCSSDIDAYANLFYEFTKLLGNEIPRGKVLDLLFETALSGDEDCGGLLSYNYLSGEHITGFSEGRPFFVRKTNAKMTLSNFFKTHLYTAVASLKVGMDILKSENVNIEKLLGHGGYFKAKNAGQTVLSSATGAEVSVMETAGEGGAYGMALLAAYSQYNNMSLDEFLIEKVFKTAKVNTVMATPKQIEGFNKYSKRFLECIDIEKTAVMNLI
jgi:sugar (pentulose or hexulose) kinase